MAVNAELLRRIETITQQKQGVGALVQSAIAVYDDHQLVQQLEAVRGRKLHLDLDNFVLFTRAASNLAISETEAKTIYIDNLYSAENVMDRWDSVVRIIRRRIFLIFVAREIAANEAFLTQRAFSPTGILRPQKYFDRVIDSPLRQRDKDDFSVVKVMSASLQHTELVGMLQKSRSKQRSYSAAITNTLATLSQNVGYGDKKSAKSFALSVGVRRVEVLFLKLCKKYRYLAWCKWRGVTKMLKYSSDAQNFIRHIGAVEVERVLQIMFLKFLRRVLYQIREQALWLGQLEKLAAIIEIQRLWRGALDRKHIADKARCNAATHIQRIIRGRQGKKRARKQFLFVRGWKAAQRLQRWWKTLTWQRIMVKHRIRRRRNLASIQIQRIIRGRVGRKRFKRFWHIHLQKIGATKMQSLFRRYKAVIYVDKFSAFLKRERSIIKLQCFFRVVRAKWRVKRQRKFLRSVLIVQCFARVLAAVRKTQQKRELRATCIIQSVSRGFIWRRRVAKIRRIRKNATLMICTLILGWMARRIWVPVLDARKKKKKWAIFILQTRLRAIMLGRRTRTRLRQLFKAANCIQRAFRKMVARRIAGNLIHDIRRKAITKIQKLWRGRMGRIRFKAVKFSLKSLVSKAPIYYQLKIEYMRSQNMFHRPYLIRLQCAYRCRLARLKVQRFRRYKCASRIQRRFRMYLQTKAAKRQLRELRAARILRDKSILIIQRVARGFMGRYEARKHYRAEEVKWFLHEIKATGLIGQALSQFRVRKKALDRAHAAAKVIQALVRGVLGRADFQRNYKRLVREREKRMKKKREKACIVIQSKFFRVVLARKRVEKRRFAMQEYKREQQLIQEFEARLDFVHEEHLTGLLATRIETGVRERLAKKNVLALKLQEKERQANSVIRHRNVSAAKIQALVRGVQSRVRFLKNLPALKKSQAARGFCVECENKVARRRCRECRDNFCEACFEKLHKKGKRKDHNWVGIVTTTGRESRPGAGEKLQAIAMKGPKWEEYWDESAKANYWFNVETGEATWIKPAGFLG